MMFWKILQIEPTTDTKIITMAYRERLVDSNPEEKPEQFKMLRDAYEQALAYARSGGNIQISSVQLWQQQLSELYFDFKKRINLDCWENLLSQPVCKSIDTRGQIEEILLSFLMENYYLPQSVYIYLNEQFDFINRLDELYESYNKDFIDYVIVNGVKYEGVLKYDLFVPGQNGEEVDKYIRTFYKLRASDENLNENLNSLKENKEYHPYGEALVIRNKLDNGVDCLNELEQLAEKYDCDYFISTILAQVLYERQQYDLVEQLCLKCNEKNGKKSILVWLLAQTLAKQQKYSEAISQLDYLQRSNADNSYSMDDINELRTFCNDRLIEEYEKKYQENPFDSEMNISYCWALLQNNHLEKADVISRNIKEEEVDAFNYYNLRSALDYVLKREEGIENLDRLIEIIRNMEEDGTEKTTERKKRLAEMISRKAYLLLAINHTEEAIQTYYQALQADSNDVHILIDLASVLSTEKKYDEAVTCLKQALNIVPDHSVAYYLLTNCYYKMGDDSNAFECVNRSLNLYAGSLECYIIKMRILIRNNGFDAAEEILKFLIDNNCGTYLDVMYCQANILEFRDKNYEQAKEIYGLIIDGIKQDESCSVRADTYYRYLYLIGMDKNANKEEERNEMLEIAETGLKYNPQYYGLLDYKAWLLMKAGNFDESMEIYRLLETYPNHSPEVEYEIGVLYYNHKLDQQADVAIEYFRKALDKGYDAGLYELTYALYASGRYEEAKEVCLKLREKADKEGYLDVDSYHRMSYICQKEKNYSQALVEAMQALENARKRNIKKERYYLHVAQLYRIMKQPQKAIEIIQQMGEEIENSSADSEMTKVYLQFGMYEQAKALIDKRIEEGKPNGCIDSVTLDFLRRNINSAKKTLLERKDQIDKKDAQTANFFIYEYEGNYQENLAARMKVLEEKGDEASAYDIIQVAEAFLLLNYEDSALKYGQMALDKLNNSRRIYSPYRTLDDVTLARIYIVLKRFDEAEELLKQAQCNLCEHCNYWGCKDADMFEIMLMTRQQRYEEAMALCEKCSEEWLDEVDFISEKELIKRQS